jgi:hypothetical protein
VLQSLPLIFQK